MLHSKTWYSIHTMRNKNAPRGTVFDFKPKPEWSDEIAQQVHLSSQYRSHMVVVLGKALKRPPGWVRIATAMSIRPYIRTFLIWSGYVDLTYEFQPESLPSYISYKKTPEGWCTIETMRKFRRANNLTFAIIYKNRQSRRGPIGDFEWNNQVGWAGCDAPGEIFWYLTK